MKFVSICVWQPQIGKNPSNLWCGNHKITTPVKNRAYIERVKIAGEIVIYNTTKNLLCRGKILYLELTFRQERLSLEDLLGRNNSMKGILPKKSVIDWIRMYIANICIKLFKCMHNLWEKLSAVPIWKQYKTGRQALHTDSGGVYHLHKTENPEILVETQTLRKMCPSRTWKIGAMEQYRNSHTERRNRGRIAQ